MATVFLVLLAWAYLIALARVIAWRRGRAGDWAFFYATFSGVAIGAAHYGIAQASASVVTVSGESALEPTPWALILLGCAAAVTLLYAAMPDKPEPAGGASGAAG